MAVFFTNVCKFDHCEKIFSTLPELIVHIESEHLDFSPEACQKIETERPQCLPMSYVLKYNKTIVRPDINVCNNNNSNMKKSNVVPREPIAIDSEEEEPIPRYYKKSLDPNFFWESKSKRFTCSIPGCQKTYKNVNGIKYHLKNGHDNKKRMKIFHCFCGRTYKTSQGLKTHSATHKQYASMDAMRNFNRDHFIPNHRISGLNFQMYNWNKYDSMNTGDNIVQPNINVNYNKSNTANHTFKEYAQKSVMETYTGKQAHHGNGLPSSSSF